MKLARKILILTIVLTMVLATTVMWFISEQIKAAETRRARDNIQQSMLGYFQSIRSRHEVVAKLVRLLTEDPNVRSELERAGDSGNTTQIRESILGQVLQRELVIEDSKPAFHLLFDERRSLLTSFGIEEATAAKLALPVDETLRGTELSRTRRYLVVDQSLYLALGVPICTDLSDPQQTPTHAYFVCYRVDDAWMSRLVSGASSDVTLRALFVVNSKVLARAGSSRVVESLLESSVPLIATTQADATSLSLRDLRTDDPPETLLVGQIPVDPGAGSRATLFVYSSLTEALQPFKELRKKIFIATICVLPLIVNIVARSMRALVQRPIQQLVEASRGISSGDFARRLPEKRRDEFGELARAFNSMSAGLAQRDAIKNTFGKFVDPKIVEGFLSDPTRLRLGGEKRVQTIMFADLGGFTAMSERLAPERVFQALNTYLEVAADAIESEKGIVDKFLGDGVLAFFGPPLQEDHQIAVCRAALRITQRIEALDALDGMKMRVRIGIATGEVLIGNVGSKNKYNYTVLGDAANLASRLEGVNKLYGTSILISGATAQAAGGAIVTRLIDTVRVIGRAEPVEIHEVLGEAGHTDSALLASRDRFNQATKHYRDQEFGAARDIFSTIEDEPSRQMALRCEALIEKPPAQWDGVWNLATK